MTAPRPVTVLVADDDPDDRLMTQKAFEQANLDADLRFVQDGEELLDYLHRRGGYADPARSPRPAQVLLDLNMPKKDGREALREMRAEPTLRRIRVVVLTTSKSEEDVSASYEISAASFITKPAKFSDLVEVVRVLGRYWLETVVLPSEG